MAHSTTLWHYRRICTHMVPKMDLFEKRTGSYALKLVQGSYSYASASANTHARGGAADSEGDRYAASVLRTAMNIGRSCILLVWARFWTGNWHLHILDPSCTDLSAAARTQFYLFGKGYDGQVGNKPDNGSRTYASQIMAAYRRAHP